MSILWGLYFRGLNKRKVIGIVIKSVHRDRQKEINYTIITPLSERKTGKIPEGMPGKKWIFEMKK